MLLRFRLLSEMRLRLNSDSERSTNPDYEENSEQNSNYKTD